MFVIGIVKRQRHACRSQIPEVGKVVDVSCASHVEAWTAPISKLGLGFHAEACELGHGVATQKLVWNWTIFAQIDLDRRCRLRQRLIVIYTAIIDVGIGPELH